MVTMVLPTPSSEITPKHDEDMGGTGEKNIGGQLGLVRIYSTQRPNKTLDNSLQNSPFWKQARPSVAWRIIVNKKECINFPPAHRLGHFEFKTLRSPTIVRLLSAAVSQVKNYKKNILPSGYAGGSAIFWLPPIPREEEIKISHVANFICPTTQLLKHPARSAFKRLILTMPLCQHLLLTMSSIPMSIKLNDYESKKGHITQWSPIPYAISKLVY